ncbi:family 78 glycoside hydrolase catalytic domain [Liquorilactobacillus satsumensis]|uniref:family 78 glycoside hydrolase catalytic domain n=1 Tax=Liquorilactobacillus satsumensis TaxID=259059 RepID=UPI0039E7E410
MSEKILAPTHLNVNLNEFAYDVDKDALFSWWDRSEIKDSFQTFYQIVIAKRLTQLTINDYILNTGWIKSRDNNGIKITNIEQILEDGQLYYWQVRIRDERGNTSSFSKPNKFICTANDNNFDDHGIWAAALTKPVDELPSLGNISFIRSPKFNLEKDEIDTAVVKAVSRGNEPLLAQGFDLYFNNCCIGLGSARPQESYLQTDTTAIYYNKYDVTSLIKSGVNNISAMASGVASNRAFWCSLDVYLANGSKKRIIKTSDKWVAVDGTNAFGDFGAKIRSLYFEMMLENIDMHYYPQGWTNIDFDDRHWKKAVPNADPMLSYNEILIPYRSGNTRRFLCDSSATTVKELQPNDYLIDLKKEIIGSLNVSITSPTTQRISVRMGEQLEQDGSVRHHLACGPDYVETWTLVKGQNKFTTFQMKNFRYLELIGFNGTLNPEDVKGWAIEQEFDEHEGTFNSSNHLLNYEYELSKYTIKATNQDVYVDSQARERKPYEGDLLVNGNTSYSVSSNYSLARHSVDFLLDNPTWPEDYKLFNVEMAWLDYMYTNDSRLLFKRYAVLKNKFNRGENGTDNFDDTVGLVTGNGLIDWPIRERDGFVEGKYNTPFNAIYYGTYLIMSKIAMVTGHTQDIQLYTERANIIKESLINKLYNSNEGKFYDSLNSDLSVNRHYAHHSSAYALCYGVYSNQEMADQISAFVANDGEFIGSVYFIYFMLKGLITTGHADKAIALLANADDRKNKKTFAAILNQLNATIAPEAWSNYYKPNLTLSHPWGATPGLTIVQGIMGIMPIKPGFAEFSVRVRPGKIEHLDVTTPSSKGIIRVIYDKNGNLEVVVPFNSKAQIDLPPNYRVISVDDQSDFPLQHGKIIISSGKHTLNFAQVV